MCRLVGRLAGIEATPGSSKPKWGPANGSHRSADGLAFGRGGSCLEWYGGRSACRGLGGIAVGVLTYINSDNGEAIIAAPLQGRVSLRCRHRSSGVLARIFRISVFVSASHARSWSDRLWAARSSRPPLPGGNGIWAAGLYGPPTAFAPRAGRKATRSLPLVGGSHQRRDLGKKCRTRLCPTGRAVRGRIPNSTARPNVVESPGCVETSTR